MIHRIFLLCTLIVGIVTPSFSQITVFMASPAHNIKIDTLWGGTCYRERNGQVAPASHKKHAIETTFLKNDERLVYYMLADECTASIRLNAHAEKKAQPLLNVTVTCVENGQTISNRLIKTRFNGGPQKVYAMQTRRLPQKSWYRIEIAANNWIALNTIDFIEIEHNSSSAIKASPILMAPSVHLNNWSSTDINAPKGQAYDWAYMEVMLPKRYERKNTYVMSLGILNGYMGIQTVDNNNDQQYQHRVLFSMWDNGDTDKDNKMPDYLRSGSLDWADDIAIKRFGGEGTGTQAMNTNASWQCDNWVQFIATCRPEVIAVNTTTASGQDTTIQYTNTLVTAWYKEAHESSWRYLATHRESGFNHYIGSWYSFLENFTDDGGEFYRRAYYRNGYLHSLADNKWYNCNRVGFGHTQGKPSEPRYDYGHGVSSLYSNCFYLEQGGYTLNANDSLDTHPIAQNSIPVDTINLNSLWQRMQQAIRREGTKQIDELISMASKHTDSLNELKKICQNLIEHAGEFDYYSSQDLSELKTAYNNGQNDDANALTNALRQLALNHNMLKWGLVGRVEHIGVTHAYQLRTPEGKTLQAALNGNTGLITLTDQDLATDHACNWQFLRLQNNANKFHVLNKALNKYLIPGEKPSLSSSPVEVEITAADGLFTIKGKQGSTITYLIDNYYCELDFEK